MTIEVVNEGEPKWSEGFVEKLLSMLGEPYRVREVGNWRVVVWHVNGLSIVLDGDVLRVLDLETGDFLTNEEEIMERVENG